MKRDSEAWLGEFDRAFEWIADVFPRADLRERGRKYVLGLLSSTERKNSWQIAETMGDETPYACQRLLGRASWNADDCRDGLLKLVREELADEQAILVVDETGFLKKGTHSAGVQRQYSGTAGRVENCQVGVFLAYHSRETQVLIDRELYLPQSWTGDRERCRQAGIPDPEKFVDKPGQAQQMIQRAIDQKLPFAWVTADTVYGNNPDLREFLEQKQRRYVMAVPCDHEILVEGESTRIDRYVDQLPGSGWRKHSCGSGTRGEREYDWAVIRFDERTFEGFEEGVLVRRSRRDRSEKAYYRYHAEAGLSGKVLCGVAGSRWSVENAIQNGKGETGLDEYQVRRYEGWYRHITLSIFALTVLALIQRLESREPAGAKAVPKKRRTRVID